MKPETIESPLSPEKIKSALSAHADASFEDNLAGHLRFLFSLRNTNCYEKDGQFIFWAKTRMAKLFFPILVARINPSAKGATVEFRIHSNAVWPVVFGLITLSLFGIVVKEAGVHVQGFLSLAGLLPAFLAFWLIDRHEKKHMRLAFEMFFRQEQPEEK